MPVFALPWVFASAVAAAAAVVALHLLAVDRPPVAPFPPARFLAGAPARAMARQRWPRDLPLLLVRVLLLLAAGAALAGMRWDPAAPPVVRVVVGDAADSAASPVWARRARAAGEVLLWVPGLSVDPGRALAAAQRGAAAAVAANPGASRVQLTVRLPARVRDLASWGVWRPQWPGTVAVLPAAGTGWPQTAAPGTEPLPRVAWPRDGVPAGWTARAAPDTVGAWAAFGVVLVGPWERRALAPGRAGETPVAWWSDGAVAAVERAGADGRCERIVGVPHPMGSDLLLAPAALAVRRALEAPCGGRLVTRAFADTLAGTAPGPTGPTGPLAPAGAFAVRSETARPWPPSLGAMLWLLALAALVAEGWMRRWAARGIA